MKGHLCVVKQNVTRLRKVEMGSGNAGEWGLTPAWGGEEIQG